MWAVTQKILYQTKRALFVCWKFKKIAKIGFGKKNQLSAQCVHTWANDTCYTNIYDFRHTSHISFSNKLIYTLCVCVNVKFLNHMCVDGMCKYRFKSSQFILSYVKSCKCK